MASDPVEVVNSNNEEEEALRAPEPFNYGFGDLEKTQKYIQEQANIIRSGGISNARAAAPKLTLPNISPVEYNNGTIIPTRRNYNYGFGNEHKQPIFTPKELPNYRSLLDKYGKPPTEEEVTAEEEMTEEEGGGGAGSRTNNNPSAAERMSAHLRALANAGTPSSGIPSSGTSSGGMRRNRKSKRNNRKSRSKKNRNRKSRRQRQ